MKELLVFFLVSILTFELNAQGNLAKKWDYRYGGTNYDAFTILQPLKEGGFILGGDSYSGMDGNKTQPNWDTSLQTSDFWIVKVDSFGKKIWDRRFGGTDYDGLNSLQQTKDGGFIAGGFSISNISGDKTDPLRGGEDFWVVKMDGNGNKQWDKRFGGSMDDDISALAQAMDGGYILAGISNSGIGGDKTEDDWDPTYRKYDFWVVKIDSLGNKEWDKVFGGIDNDFPSSVLVTGDGSFIITGFSASDSSGTKTQNTKGSGDYWMIKIDSAGTQLWDMDFGGTEDDNLVSMATTRDGGYILGGYTSSGIGGDKTQDICGNSYDYWIVKLDSAANKQWDKDFGGTGDDDLENVIQTLDGGYLLSGWTDSPQSCDKSEYNMGTEQPWIVKTDSAGNKQWDKTIFAPGWDAVGYAIQTTDGCYLIGAEASGGVGGYKSQPNWDPTNQTYDYWIIKFCDSALAGIPTLTPSGAQVTISPNPFATDIAIGIQKHGLSKAEFTIYNLLGQPVYNKTETNLSPAYTKMLDLSYLPSGIYFVAVVVDGERVVKEVVKAP